MTARRAFVTGASGFVGRHAIQSLLDRGFEVHAAVHCGGARLPAGVTAYAMDLLDWAGSGPLLDKIRPTHLLHLAWEVTPGRYWHAPANLDWVAASLRLYRAFAASGGRRAVFAGTCAEYDWTTNLLDEAMTPLRPDSLYGTSKDALRRILVAAAERDGISLAWARLFFLYGPGEAANRLVPDVVQALLRGEPAMCGDGRAERDFMHVADAGAALAATLDSATTGPVNIASGTCVSVRVVVQTLAGLTERPELIRFGARPTPAGEPPRLAASVAILRERIGFTPRFQLAEGLADTLRWWRAHLSQAPA